MKSLPTAFKAVTLAKYVALTLWLVYLCTSVLQNCIHKVPAAQIILFSNATVNECDMTVPASKLYR